KQHIQHLGLSFNDFHDNWVYCGFQVVGYDQHEPVTYNVQVGKKLQIDPYSGLDVTVCGQMDVATALFNLYQANPESTPLIEGFSLQDAIDYAEFLIRTTALHQRFSRAIPSVGGDIDIALVTPFDRFRWIKQKELYSQVGIKKGG